MTAMQRAADFAHSYRVRALSALRIPGSALHVIGERETLEAIRERRASLARYGDGELEIMIGGSIRFQEFDSSLAQRLRRILRAPNPQFLVGIPNFDSLQIQTQSRKGNWERYRRLFSHLVRRGASYHSAFVSRPAGILNLESAGYFQAWEKIFADRNLVIVHHTEAMSQHPLFSPARKVSFVQCAPQHAYREYPTLLARAAEHCTEAEALFLIAAGPVAGVLAWDLAERGAQALDIGHLTAAYDEFTRKS